MRLFTFNYNILRAGIIRNAVVAIFLLLGDVLSLQAQNVVIKGKVIDDQKSPLELAQVHVEGTGFGAVCNLKGEYRMTCESADSLVVVFSMIGYETRKRVLTNDVALVRLRIG